jgi:hypothetical protein
VVQLLGRRTGRRRGELAAAYSKLEAASARFALLYHIISHAVIGSDDAVAVGVESTEAGITLARWFAGEARRIYANHLESAEEKDTCRLIDFINSHGGEITPHDLWKSNTRHYRSSEGARLALAALEDAGVGVLLYRPSGPSGGRPTEVFRIICTRNHPKPSRPRWRLGGRRTRNSLRRKRNH